jgi:hypothetical protein
MKIPLKKSQLKENIIAFMRRSGYVPFHDSYVRVLGSGGYPRFHVYVHDEEERYVLNMHLDQKRPSYGEETAHSGDYEGPVIEAEAERIEDFLFG